MMIQLSRYKQITKTIYMAITILMILGVVACKQTEKESISMDLTKDKKRKEVIYQVYKFSYGV